MRFQAILPALIVGVVHGAAVGEPSCQRQCLIQAIAETKCEVSDVACICSKAVFMDAAGACITDECGASQDAYENGFQDAGLYCTGLDAELGQDLSRLSKNGFAEDFRGTDRISYGGRDTPKRSRAIKSWPRFWRWWKSHVYQDAKWHIGAKGWNFLKHQAGFAEWQAFWLESSEAWSAWKVAINEAPVLSKQQPAGDLRRRADEHTTHRPTTQKPTHTTTKPANTTTKPPNTTTKPSNTTTKPSSTTSSPSTTQPPTTQSSTVPHYSSTTASSMAFF